MDNYFGGGRSALRRFSGERIHKYHKTLSTNVGGLFKNGFEITGLAEPQPEQNLLDRVEGMHDELRCPMMLIVTARKK